MFLVELRLYTVSALTVRVVILPDFSAARAFAAATRIWPQNAAVLPLSIPTILSILFC